MGGNRFYKGGVWVALKKHFSLLVIHITYSHNNKSGMPIAIIINGSTNYGMPIRIINNGQSRVRAWTNHKTKKIIMNTI